MEPRAIPPDVRLEPAELLAHASWVRRLARALVHDDATAADVEQQTWLAALSHPPRPGDPVRGWLRTIARNVVRKLGRDDAARRRREEQVAAREAQPSMDDAVARAELHARIVKIVLALDEPYRTTLIRRFFDELAPTAISQRDGVPVETVKTRLKRGLELVRGRIDLRALAPLLSIPSAGVTLMAVSTTKFAAVAALVLALGLVGTLILRSNSRVRDEPKVAALPASAATAEQAKAASAPADVVRVPEPAPVDARAGHVLLHGFVVDTAGAIVPDATIAWVAGGVGDEAASHSSSSADAVEVEDGQYAIEGLASGLVTFRIEATGCQPLDRTLDLKGRFGVQRHDFVVTRSIVIPVKLVTSEGKPFFTAMKESRTTGNISFSLSLVVGDRPLPAALPPLTGSFFDVTSSAGRGFLTGGGRGSPRHGPATPAGADGVIEVARLPVQASLLFRSAILATQTVASADAPVVFTVDPDRIDAQMGRITATCIDAESGDPLKDATIQCGTDNTGGSGPKVRDDGTFEIGPVAAGWIMLHVTAKGHESWHAHELVKPGETTDLGELEFERSIELTGTVTSVAGKPTDACFGVLCLDRYVRGQPFYTHDLECSDADGKFKLSSLGRRRYVVMAAAGDSARGAALFVVDLASGAAPPPLDVKLKPVTFVHVEPRVAPDEFLFAELRTAAGELVMASDVFFRRGIWESLPAGSYVVSIFDGERLLRAVPFEAIGPQLLVEFDVHDDKPAKLVTTVPTPNLHALVGEPKPTEATPPARGTEDETAIVLSGSLHDRAGAPVVNGSVTSSDATGRKHRATTSSNGSFALAGLAPGRVDVTAGAEACVETTEPVELVADATPRRLDIILDRATRVKVNFTALDGTPLEAVLRKTRSPVQAEQISVVATVEAPADRLPAKTQGVARWQPGYRRFETDSGTLDVAAPLPVFVSAVVGGRVIATQKLDAPVEELTLAIDPQRLVPKATSLQFRLIDAKTAQPIVTAFAAVTALSSMASGDPRTLPAEAGGVWTLDHLAPGRQLLCVNLTKGDFVSFVVDLVEGESNDVGDLQVLRGVELQGIAVDEQGKPSTVALRVICNGVNGEPQFDDSYNQVTPDADGHFKFAAATPFVRIQVSSRDFATDPLVVDARLAPANGIRVVVRRGVSVTLRAKLAAGATRHVVLRRDDGVLLSEFTLRSSTPQQIRLVAGNYRAVVDQDGSHVTEKKFVVADVPIEVDVGH